MARAILRFPLPKEKLLPHEIQCTSPGCQPQEAKTLDRFRGSLAGLAIGDALGASVEFRPRQYLLEHPVRGMLSGGTWGLAAGKWTDDTSMALCLASSLISRNGFDPYDQLVRYKWWYKHGYLSSTGHCFDIGNSTRNALEEFSRRQMALQRTWKVNEEQMDTYSYEDIKPSGFNVYCGGENAGGNGALMRLAPVPLFFYRDPLKAVALSGESARLTHGHPKAVDACRYYGALIVAALNGERKESLLSPNFYTEHQAWFGNKPLHREMLAVANGSFRVNDGYASGIRGSGEVVKALEAALWAFLNDENSFDKGVLKAVNLGDDTDTTGAIYGQLAGAYYGYESISREWRGQLYAKDLITCIAQCLQLLGGSDFSTHQSQQRITQNPDQPTRTLINGGDYSRQSLQKITSNPSYYSSLLPTQSTTNFPQHHGGHPSKLSATMSLTTGGQIKPQQHQSTWGSTSINSTNSTSSRYRTTEPQTKNQQHSSSWGWFRHEQ